MKKLKLKKILLLLLGILFIAGGIIMIYPKIAGLKFKNDELESCSVSTGGGMLGGYTNVTLKKDKEGNTVLIVRGKETHEDREVTTTYQADPAAFDRIREMVVKYDLYAASKRRLGPMQVMDGDTTHLSFDFSKDYFSISGEQMLNKNMRNGFNEVRKYLYSLISGEGVRTLEPQTAMLYLKSGYTLRFVVEDRFDGKLDDILGEEREVRRFGEDGIFLAPVPEGFDVSGAEALKTGAAGNIVYDSEEGGIILLYNDHEFEQNCYLLAHLDGYIKSAAPLIEEMEGEYSLRFN